jgi:hypothetical protein
MAHADFVSVLDHLQESAAQPIVEQSVEQEAFPGAGNAGEDGAAVLLEDCSASRPPAIASGRT